eukprot:CAMPEP_0175043768 /NCGR_PEP_ID=MMETSP0052_2-20121109/3391_1 /TAXON_ID=51329 ORGANISM="Polytomella parva, Strain SAG 63-3" /NCGR_SAMPLE_ID=MMETSP0052_2 /ASSEMBLY_ACC=CAM_ASM_000194 /LENGTH=1107 /DNA_ID=CAMNT_0016306905 /DNA_START=202 /DNA_END=3522 /DNA_ORIENTATION=+
MSEKAYKSLEIDDCFKSLRVEDFNGVDDSTRVSNTHGDENVYNDGTVDASGSFGLTPNRFDVGRKGPTFPQWTSESFLESKLAFQTNSTSPARCNVPAFQPSTAAETSLPFSDPTIQSQLAPAFQSTRQVPQSSVSLSPFLSSPMITSTSPSSFIPLAGSSSSGAVPFALSSAVGVLDKDTVAPETHLGQAPSVSFASMSMSELSHVSRPSERVPPLFERNTQAADDPICPSLPLPLPLPFSPPSPPLAPLLSPPSFVNPRENESMGVLLQMACLPKPQDLDSDLDRMGEAKTKVRENGWDEIKSTTHVASEGDDVKVNGINQQSSKNSASCDFHNIDGHCHRNSLCNSNGDMSRQIKTDGFYWDKDSEKTIYFPPSSADHFHSFNVKEEAEDSNTSVLLMQPDLLGNEDKRNRELFGLAVGTGALFDRSLSQLLDDDDDVAAEAEALVAAETEAAAAAAAAAAASIASEREDLRKKAPSVTKNDLLSSNNRIIMLSIHLDASISDPSTAAFTTTSTILNASDDNRSNTCNFVVASTDATDNKEGGRENSSYGVVNNQISYSDVNGYQDITHNDNASDELNSWSSRGCMNQDNSNSSINNSNMLEINRYGSDCNQSMRDSDFSAASLVLYNATNQMQQTSHQMNVCDNGDMKPLLNNYGSSDNNIDDINNKGCSIFHINNINDDDDDDGRRNDPAIFRKRISSIMNNGDSDFLHSTAILKEQCSFTPSSPTLHHASPCPPSLTQAANNGVRADKGVKGDRGGEETVVKDQKGEREGLIEETRGYEEEKREGCDGTSEAIDRRSDDVVKAIETATSFTGFATQAIASNDSSPPRPSSSSPFISSFPSVVSPSLPTLSITKASDNPFLMQASLPDIPSSPGPSSFSLHSSSSPLSSRPSPLSSRSSPLPPRSPTPLVLHSSQSAIATTAAAATAAAAIVQIQATPPQGALQKRRKFQAPLPQLNLSIVESSVQCSVAPLALFVAAAPVESLGPTNSNPNAHHHQYHQHQHPSGQGCISHVNGGSDQNNIDLYNSHTSRRPSSDVGVDNTCNSSYDQSNSLDLNLNPSLNPNPNPFNNTNDAFAYSPLSSPGSEFSYASAGPSFSRPPSL